MICGYAGFSDEKTATSHKRTNLSVYPNVEILMSFGSCKGNMHTLNDTPALGRGEEECAQVDFGLCDAIIMT